MDGYDAFSAGVEPGGLRNRNEIKVLIAFLLKNTERGLSRRQLMEVIQREGLANYFEASQALESLIEGGSVEADESDNDELLSLTAAGKTAANIEDELPRAVRDKALTTAEELLKQERRMKETPVEIIPLENGCNVRFTFNDLMTLTLYVADMEQAQSVRDKILADPESLYSAVIEQLM